MPYASDRINLVKMKIKLNLYWIRGLKARGIDWVEAICPFIALALTILL